MRPISRSSWSAPSISRRSRRCSNGTSRRCRQPAARTSQAKPLGFHFPRHGAEGRGANGDASRRARRVITYFVDAGSDEDEIALADAAADVLQMRLRDELREALGSTYSVSASYGNILPRARLRHARHRLWQLSRKCGQARRRRRLAGQGASQRKGRPPTRSRRCASRTGRISRPRRSRIPTGCRRCNPPTCWAGTPSRSSNVPRGWRASRPSASTRRRSDTFPTRRYTVATLVPEKTASSGSAAAPSTSTPKP